VSDQKNTKKISAKAIMADLKANLSDGQLMEKYGLSFQGLQDLFAKLIQAKLATETYFQKRAMKQTVRPVASETGTSCPYCGYQGLESFTHCPRCKQDISEWLDTVELTKILSFE